MPDAYSFTMTKTKSSRAKRGRLTIDPIQPLTSTGPSRPREHIQVQVGVNRPNTTSAQGDVWL